MMVQFLERINVRCFVVVFCCACGTQEFVFCCRVVIPFLALYCCCVWVRFDGFSGIPILSDVHRHPDSEHNEIQPGGRTV